MIICECCVETLNYNVNKLIEVSKSTVFYDNYNAFIEFGKPILTFKKLKMLLLKQVIL